MGTKMTLITIGKLKSGPWYDLSQDYLKRLTPALQVYSLDGRHKLPPAERIQREGELIIQKIPAKAMVIICDEKGKNMTSIQFANNIVAPNPRNLCFIIGGAYGLSESVRNRADAEISFGSSTWPHLMVRVMLLEQLYRAQQILVGHPYHKD